MRLERIIEAVYTQPWAILPANHRAIQQLIEAHLNGASLLDFTDPDEQTPAYEVSGTTAIVPIVGTILNKCSGLEAMCGAFSCQAFRQTLRTVAADDNIENIILNISSGGGIITGVPETADLIARVTSIKPVYAFTDDVIASAAYWLASQANGIFASKSAQVGSIGIYMALLDTSAMFQNEGIKVELFKAGTNKAMGLPGTSLTDDQRQILQASVDKAYQQFTSYITAKRPKVSTDTMQGLTYDTDDAVSLGLIDGELSELDELIQFLNA